MTDTQMALSLSNPYDVYEVLTFKRLCVKFHDISMNKKKNDSHLSEATVVIFKTMDSKQFRVLIYHCFLIKKKKKTVQRRYKKFRKCFNIAIELICEYNDLFRLTVYLFMFTVKCCIKYLNCFISDL